MDAKRVPPCCAVCLKRSENECSHVECPNRKLITAAPPQGADVWPIRNGVMRLPTCRD